MLELPKMLLGNIGFRTEARLLDVSDNLGQGSTDLADVVVDATCGQLQLPGDGAHRVTVLKNHQNDGGVGGRDASALGGLMDGMDGHLGCMGPATQRVGIRISEGHTGGREFLVHLDVLGTLGEAAGVSPLHEAQGVGDGCCGNPFLFVGAFPEPP